MMGKLLLLCIIIVVIVTNIPFWYYFSYFGPDWYTSIGWTEHIDGSLFHWPSWFMATSIQVITFIICQAFGSTTEDNCDGE